MNAANKGRIGAVRAPRRLWLAAAATVVFAFAGMPVACSQGSDDARPSCDTVLGYWTPLPEGFQAVALVLVVVLVVAALLRRRPR